MLPLAMALLLAQTDLGAPDAAARLAAVQRVERAGADGSPDVAHLTPLAKLLTDPDVQTRGLAALALSRHVVATTERVPENVVAPLLHGLRDDNAHVAAYCRRALLVLGERALPEVRTAAGPAQPRTQRLAALEAARHLAGLEPCQLAVDALFWKLLADADGVVRDRAFVLLVALRADHKLPPLRDVASLTAALRSEASRIRELAGNHLVALDEAGFPVVADLLDDRAKATRAQAAKVLEALLARELSPEPPLTPKLLASLERELLAETRGLRVDLAILVRAQKSPPAEVIAAVDAALAKIVALGDFDNREAFKLIAPIEAEAVKVLVDRLVANDPKTQAAAAAMLRPIYLSGRVALTRQALTNFATALGSPRIETAQEVALTLRYCLRPTRRVTPGLLEALQRALARPNEVLRWRCCVALAGCGAQAEPVVLVLLQGQDRATQAEAAQVVELMASLHGIALPAAEPHLKRLLGSTDPEVRKYAARAMTALRRLSPGGRP
jgi:hypothetical protein